VLESSVWGLYFETSTCQTHVAHKLEPSGFGEAIFTPGPDSNLWPSGPQLQSWMGIYGG